MSPSHICYINQLRPKIAALQQVEKGLIGMDDDAGLYKICPELEKLQVFEGFDENGKGKLRDARTKMTLRMLLNHTCGESTGVL